MCWIFIKVFMPLILIEKLPIILFNGRTIFIVISTICSIEFDFFAYDPYIRSTSICCWIGESRTRTGTRARFLRFFLSCKTPCIGLIGEITIISNSIPMLYNAAFIPASLAQQYSPTPRMIIRSLRIHVYPNILGYRPSCRSNHETAAR